MKHNNDFKYDLEVGNVMEREVADILENKTIEVKWDLQAEKTGNVFVEYSSRGKLSGISVTQSDYYMFVIGEGTMFIIETSKLKRICRKFLNTNRDTVGGDSNTSKGILLSINNIITK